MDTLALVKGFKIPGHMSNEKFHYLGESRHSHHNLAFSSGLLSHFKGDLLIKICIHLQNILRGANLGMIKSFIQCIKTLLHFL
jgi:hypothetical protein